MLSSLILAALTLSPAGAAEYEIDPAHSSVGFKVRHLVSKTAGKFDKFTGKISYDPAKPEASKVEADIVAASINTNEPKRDKHLRSPDFFDTDKFKTLTFKSTKVHDVKDKTMKVDGDLTIHGVTKPVTLDVEMTGEGKDPWGNVATGFTATTKVNRKDFGLTWNKALETGGVLVGDDIEIALEVEAHQKAAGGDAKKAKK
ncbi:MAG: polyisoprenoid-binding protein [Deltaproteobacteria bacterium]|nr:polyisoprenoid-binding protein [Deltaproteobacteria bacterium]